MSLIISVPHGVCYKNNKLCDSKANYLASEIKRVLHGYPLNINLHIYDQDHQTHLNDYSARSHPYRKKLVQESQKNSLHLDLHSFDPNYHSDWRSYELIINISENENSDVDDLISFLRDSGVSSQVVVNPTDIKQEMEEHNITSLSIYINDHLENAEISYLARILANWFISG